MHLLILILGLLVWEPGLAAKSTSLCFDFSTKAKTVSTPLHPLPPLKKKKDLTKSGRRKKDKVNWGFRRGVVKQPIKKLYDWLLVHENWKDMSRTKIKVTYPKRKQYTDFHKMNVKVNVFGFINVKWTEEWAYTILKGTRDKPEKILASYQKTEGEPNLKKLCGSVVFEKKAPGVTDVFLYEEARSAHWSSEDILNMHKENFEDIRKLK